MRKLKLQMQVSLDGFVAGPNGEMDWLAFNWDEPLIQYVSKLTEPVDCITMGRKLAQGFIPHWTAAAKQPENSESAFARKMSDTPKVVFTKTLTSNPWENARLAQGDIREEIAQLKNQPGKDIIVYGGGNFVSNLIQHGLVDEYHLFVNPVVLGDGMTIFKGVAQKLNLRLVQASAFQCGIVVLQYVPAN